MSEIKDASTAAGGYFDPHNHFTGILPYGVLSMLTAEGVKLIARWRETSSCDLGDLGDLAIEEFLAHHTADDSLFAALHDLETRLLLMQNFSLHWGMTRLSGTLQRTLLEGDVRLDKLLTGEIAGLASRMKVARPGDAALLTLIDAINAAVLGDGLSNAVRHINENVLTATPHNDVDSAYVARGFLNVSSEDLMAAGVRELKRQNILCSEQSMPLWTLERDSAATAAASSEDVVVRWLPMLPGSFLGWIGGSHEPEEASERTILRLRTTPADDEPRGTDLTCVADHLPPPYRQWTLRWAEPAPMEWPEMNRPTMHEDLGAWIDRLRTALRYGVPYATGFDLTAPSRTWYTPEGARQVERVLRMTFEVAREQRRPLVAHIHVGEGAGGIVHDPKTNLPAHYLCAENNVEQMLRAVLRVRRSLSKEGTLPAFDRFVRVRFGHVTHVSVIQAQQMAEAGIWADVNLPTSSFLSPGPEASPGLLKKATELITQNPGLFDHHALITLLSCGVRVMLGTGGGGIEHTDMPREYALAEAILRLNVERVDRGVFTLLSSAKRAMPLLLNREASNSLKHRLSIARLYENQAIHHTWTESWTEVPSPPAPAVPTGELGAELHSVFLDATAGR